MKLQFNSLKKPHPFTQGGSVFSAQGRSRLRQSRTDAALILCGLICLLLSLNACGTLQIGLERTPTPDYLTGTIAALQTENARLATAVASSEMTAPPAITPTATYTPIPTLTSSATATSSPPPPPPPTPTFTTEPAPQNLAEVTLTGPLLIDSEDGRLYMTGQRGENQQIFVLSASEAHLLATYDVTGQLGLDPVHNRLYADQGDQGLAVLNAQTGTGKAVIPLPGASDPAGQSPAPLADPASDLVLAFRDNMVYIVDPEQATVVRTIPFDVPKADDCRTLDQSLPIEGALYDAAQRILYLDFMTYVCTPWFENTLLSYDLAAGSEIARQETLPFQATPFDGRLYGSSWHRFGLGYRWIWREGRLAFESADWGGNLSSIQVDLVRQWLYEATDSNLRILDADTMSLVMSLPQPVTGQLAGYDPQTDQLYFLDDGRLHPWPVSAIQAPSPEPLLAAQPPASPIRTLIVSPAWSQDKTLFGLWGNEVLTGNCYVFDQPGGWLYISQDGGKTWGRPRGGLAGGCEAMSALAVSPAYAQDRTLLAGLLGMGVFKSTDGAQLWQPTSAGLSSMGVKQLLISPGFSRDATLFANVRTGGLHRSADGGRTWQGLEVDLSPLAMSPEFEQDHILMGVASGDSGQRIELHISRNGGTSWEQVGHTPEDVPFTFLSLAPLFEKWEVVFGYGTNGLLYRSADAGLSWQAVLQTDPIATGPPQLVYAPHIEVNRPVFLLTTTTAAAGPDSVRGQLYRSGDGGQTWQAVQLPEDVSPTALTISPDFVRDGLLFLGTADGQVLILDKNHQ